MKNERGFTLIELLATLVVVALITAIIIPITKIKTSRSKNLNFLSLILSIINFEARNPKYNPFNKTITSGIFSKSCILIVKNCPTERTK